jgi:hypothetical protein
LVGVLELIGVKQIFGLIGDSLNPLADAIRRSQIEWIGVRHEEGAALAAAGQAKLTGRLAVCAGTTGPGSNHLVAGLYEASRDHAPVLALSGDEASPVVARTTLPADATMLFDGCNMLIALSRPTRTRNRCRPRWDDDVSLRMTISHSVVDSLTIICAVCHHRCDPGCDLIKKTH